MNANKLSDIFNAMIQGLIRLETTLSTAANEYARSYHELESFELVGGDPSDHLPKHVFLARFDRAVEQFNTDKQELFRSLVETHVNDLRNESAELYNQWFDGLISHEEYITRVLDHAMLNERV